MQFYSSFTIIDIGESAELISFTKSSLLQSQWAPFNVTIVLEKPYSILRFLNFLKLIPNNLASFVNIFYLSSLVLNFMIIEDLLNLE